MKTRLLGIPTLKNIKKRQSGATFGNDFDRNRASAKTFSRLSFLMIFGGSKSQEIVNFHETLPFFALKRTTLLRFYEIAKINFSDQILRVHLDKELLLFAAISAI